MSIGKHAENLLEVLTGGSELRAVQSLALESGLLFSRKNVLVAAPTNSGKSLIGTLVLLDVVRNGKRAVLIEPLRALANEKAENLSRHEEELSRILKVDVSVKVTTGDYRLQDEEFADPAPKGELIVCTPERLDAILRNPDNQAWVESIGAVCLDEAHMIRDQNRGPTQEILLTSLMMLPAPPRLVLLSATMGSLERAKDWLAPCDIYSVTERYPPLRKQVLEVGPDQDADDVIVEWLSAELAEPDSQALVFVYKPVSTIALASKLTDEMGELVGTDGACAYNAQMSAAQRSVARESFLAGRSRIAVATSALAMGVNLPATHVVVRDLTYFGGGSPQVSDLLQMMGRAGRGDREGHAVVIKRPSDDWNTAELQRALDEEHLPDFGSAFTTDADDRDDPRELVAPLVASLLSRFGDNGLTEEALEQFFSRSLGGSQLVSHVSPAVHWLVQKKLAHKDSNTYHLTVLGRRAARAVLPLPLAAGLAQLIRDLMSVDESDRLLGEWRELDHLIVLYALYDRRPSLRKFSKDLAAQVMTWIEGAPENTSMLFREWIAGEKGHSKAGEVLASLGIQSPKDNRDKPEWARKRGYLAIFHGIVTLERGQGRSVADLERQYKLKNLEGIEEKWRDELMWLLSGIAQLLEVKTFFYHLREECDASPERIKRIKRLLGSRRHQVYDLQEKLKYCSPLGPALRDIRRLTGGGVGVQTIRKLEAAGIDNLLQLQRLGTDGIVACGIRRDIAKRIQFYLTRRMA